MKVSEFFALPGPCSVVPLWEVKKRTLLRDKEQMITLYRQAASGTEKPAPALEAFRLRHVEHLTALRKLLPEDNRTGDAAPGTSPSGSPSPSPAVTVDELRDAERRAAAARPGQMAKASPVLAQLLASIGACEAVHAVALGRLRD